MRLHIIKWPDKQHIGTTYGETPCVGEFIRLSYDDERYKVVVISRNYICYVKWSIATVTIKNIVLMCL